MVATFQAIYKKDSADIATRFKANAAELRERVLKKMADVVVDNSPVDTGTYVMAHRARTSGAAGGDTPRSSHGKPRGVSAPQFKNLARGNLYRSVSAAAISASADVYFVNIAEHARFVEYLGWKGTPAYHVYARLRNVAPVLIQQTASEMGYDTR